jgi:molybdenum cofactor synthesis domain-containing protein
VATVRPIRATIPIEEARALVLGSAAPVERTERLAVRDAQGRVLAATPVSSTDVPPFDRAAMDGYAVAAEDTFGASQSNAAVLRVIETVFTGQVVMVEETERHGDDVRIQSPVFPRQHVGRRGADIAEGQALLHPGDVLTPSRVGALAAIGLTEIEVFAKPRVAIVSTGDEIVAPGQPLAPGQLYDINQFTLSSIVAAHGGVPVAYPAVADDLSALNAAATAADGDDILVFSGGSSVGEHDLVIDMIGGLGEVLFHGVAVKPGKPTTFGRIGRRVVFGMPGYPTSCLSNGYMLLVPLLRRVARLPEYQPHTVRLPLSRRVVSTTGRHQFYTVRIQDGAAVPAFKASGDITSMAHADGYIEIPAHTDIVEAGETVVVKLF